MRIIQRCLLILAFTGVFLCHAQDLSTIADVSDFSKSNDQTSKSAPESSSIKIDKPFLGVVKEEKELIIPSEDKSSKAGLHESVTDAPPVKSDISGTHAPAEETNRRRDSLDDSSSVLLTTESSKNHSERGITEVHDAVTKDLSTNEIVVASSANLGKDNISGQSNESTSSDNVRHSEVETTESEEEFLNNVHGENFEKTSVPSAEDLIYKVSTVEDCYSTSSSRLQTGESTEADPKSSTQKRSLNSTRSETEDPLDDDLILAVEVTTSSDEPELLTKVGADSSSEDVLSSKNINTSNATDESQSNGAASSSNPDHISSHSTTVKYENISEVEKIINTPVSPLEVEPLLSVSSVALSTPNEESIHFSENLSSIQEASHISHSVYSTPYKSELEVEDNPSTGTLNLLESEESLVTFDPNGMTNNYTQDPDSVTFIPKFKVDGKQTDGYSSRLETNDRIKDKSEIVDREVNTSSDTEHILSMPSNNVSELEGSNAFEREREFVTGGGLIHDEHDREELSGQFPSEGTIKPEITQTNKATTKFEDNESEEMLNDAPEFARSKTTFSSIKKDDLDAQFTTVNIVKNSATLPSSSSKEFAESHKELEFPNIYSEQSEVRPITVASPFQTSESISDLVGKAENISSSFTTSENPESTLPHTSSPIIQPNPAPTTPDIVNLRQDGTTKVLQPDLAVGNNVTVKSINESNSNIATEDYPIVNLTTISEAVVKTSVFESLPISNGTVNLTENQTISSGSASPLPILINGADANPLTNKPTSLPKVSTTVSSGLKIRKPKIKIGGTEEPEETTRTRKPFLTPPQKPTSTEGPPVSIFKKSRTRGASITSSTTARPFPQFSTLRVHYASRNPGMIPKGEMDIFVDTISTTEATTTETEEPFSIEPFTEVTQVPIVTNEDDVTLVKVAGYIVVDKGLRWHEQLDNRHSPQYKEKANFMHLQLERLFRTSTIAPHLWKIQIDGFSTRRKSHSVAVDFFIYLIKSKHEIPAENLTTVFHEKLTNNTFSRFRVDPAKTAFEFVTEEPLKAPTPPPENFEEEPVIPQWAIAVIVVGAASLIFVILFAMVAILGRRHMRRRYSNKLNDEDSDRPSEWESKMAAAYENLAADTIYDVDDLHSDTYKKRTRPNSTYHGRPRSMLTHSSGPRRADSWSSSDWSPPPRRPRPQVHRIVY